MSLKALKCKVFSTLFFLTFMGVFICHFIADLFMFQIQIYYEIYNLQKIAPILWVAFHFFDGVLCSTKVCFLFNYFFLLLLILLVYNVLPNPVKTFYGYVFFQEFSSLSVYTQVFDSLS